MKKISTSQQGEFCLRGFKGLAFAAVLSISWMNFSFAQSGNNSELEARILEMIHQVHPTDTVTDWQSLGEQAPEAIISLYAQSSRTYEKIRLLGGLAWFPENSHAVEFLKQKAQKDSNVNVQEMAIRSLGISQGTKEIDFLTEKLSHENPRIRATSGLALCNQSDAQSQALLDRFLNEEKVNWVVKKVGSCRTTQLNKKQKASEEKLSKSLKSNQTSESDQEATRIRSRRTH
jgi:hypothetical protein